MKTEAMSGLVALAIALSFPGSLSAEDGDFDALVSDFERRAPAIGNPAPDFTLPDLRGGEGSLSALAEKGPVVIEFANSTSPESQDREGREALVEAFGSKGVQFVIVFGRETGAGAWSGGADFSQVSNPANATQRKARAEEFRKSTGTRFQVLLDRMDDRVLDQYGGLTNSVFIVAQGTREVLFRDASASGAPVEEALQEIFAGGLAVAPPPRAEEPDRDGRPDGNAAEKAGRDGRDEGDGRDPGRPARPGAGSDPRADERVRGLARWAEEAEKYLKTNRRAVGPEAAQRGLEGISVFRKTMLEVANLPESPRKQRLLDCLGEAKDHFSNAYKKEKGEEAYKCWETFKEKMAQIQRNLQSGGDEEKGDGGDGEKDGGSDDRHEKD